jgi:DNA-binding winged helix-turn-helix (wHTH) protein
MSPTDLELPPTRLRFDGGCLDLRTHELVRADCRQPLPPRLFSLLKLLLSNPGRVVSKQELREAAWPQSVVSDGALLQGMLDLRKLLKPADAADQRIVSTRGVGYRFAGDVRIEYGPSTPAAAADATAPRARLLYEQAYKRWSLLDLDGMTDSIAALRDPACGGGDGISRLRALLLESALERLAGHRDEAWLKLEAAEVAFSRGGLDVVASLLHMCRGLMLVHFASPAAALPHFQAAWDHAQAAGELTEMADSAFLLAACFGRADLRLAFEDWTNIALKLGQESGHDWLWQSHAVTLAGTGIMLGEKAEQGGDPALARRLWLRACDLLQQVMPPSDDVSTGLADVASLNHAWVLGYLSPESRPTSLALLASMQGTETRPQFRTALHLSQAELLIREQRHAEALQQGQLGLAVVESTGIERHLIGLLRASADAATALGEHALAAHCLRRMLRLRDERRDAQATQAGAAIAERLRTDRALALAASERDRARTLAADNERLRRELMLRDGEAQPRH